MKLVRYGAAGREKPGIIDEEGRIRDLSGPRARHRRRDAVAEEPCQDREGQSRQAAAGARDAAASVPASAGSAISSPSASTMPTMRPRPACRCRRSRSSSTRRRAASAVPNDDTMMPKGSTKLDYEVELGVVIGSRARYLTEEQGAGRGRRLLPGERRVRARIPDRALRPVDQGQELRRRSGRSGPGSSPRTRSRTRRSSTCGSPSTARRGRRARPRR